jgi:hypothetical protein
LCSDAPAANEVDVRNGEVARRGLLARAHDPNRQTCSTCARCTAMAGAALQRSGPSRATTRMPLQDRANPTSPCPEPDAPATNAPTPSQRDTSCRNPGLHCRQVRPVPAQRHRPAPSLHAGAAVDYSRALAA